jgi:hypothetical protein
MTITSTSDAKLVRGPLGTPLSLADLPPALLELFPAQIVIEIGQIAINLGTELVI